MKSGWRKQSSAGKGNQLPRSRSEGQQEGQHARSFEQLSGYRRKLSGRKSSFGLRGSRKSSSGATTSEPHHAIELRQARCGTLYKKGQLGKWKRRFFQCDQHELLWKVAASDKKIKGSVKLVYGQVKVEEFIDHIEQGKFYFRVTGLQPGSSKRTTLELYAESAIERQVWKELVTQQAANEGKVTQESENGSRGTNSKVFSTIEGAYVDFEVLKAGVLMKRGHYRQSWTKRFVVVFSSRIQWYQLGSTGMQLDHLRGERPIRASDLCSVSLLDAESHHLTADWLLNPFSSFSTEASGSKWRFEVCIGRYNLQLQAQSEQERFEWVRDLQRLLVDKNGTELYEDSTLEPSLSQAIILSPFQTIQANEKYNKYFKMLDFGVLLGGVLARMQADGVPESVMQTFKSGMQAPNDDLDDAEDRSGGRGRRGSRVLPKPLVPLRKVHWQPLSKQEVSGSIWATFAVNDGIEPLESAAVHTSDWQRIPPRFHASHKLQLQSLFRLYDTETSSTKSGREAASKFGYLLDAKRINNVGIGMRIFKEFKSFPALIEALTILDEQALSLQQLRQLQLLLPTTSEIKKLQRYRGAVSNLVPAEQFLWHLSCIPRVHQKVAACLFMREMSEKSEELMVYTTLLEEAINQMTSSEKLARFLDVVLAFGNHMNNSMVRGVSFTSLLALTKSKARDNKTTMLTFLCKLLQEKGEASLLELASDLSAVPSAAKVSQQRVWEIWAGVKKGRRNFDAERQQLREEEMSRYYLGQRAVERKQMAEADFRSNQKNRIKDEKDEDRTKELARVEVAKPATSSGSKAGGRFNLLAEIQNGRGGRGGRAGGGRPKGRGAMLAAIQGRGQSHKRSRQDDSGYKDGEAVQSHQQSYHDRLQKFEPSRMLHGFSSFVTSARSQLDILTKRVGSFDASLSRLQRFFALATLPDTEQVFPLITELMNSISASVKLIEDLWGKPQSCLQQSQVQVRVGQRVVTRLGMGVVEEVPHRRVLNASQLRLKQHEDEQETETGVSSSKAGKLLYSLDTLDDRKVITVRLSWGIAYLHTNALIIPAGQQVQTLFGHGRLVKQALPQDQFWSVQLSFGILRAHALSGAVIPFGSMNSTAATEAEEKDESPAITRQSTPITESEERIQLEDDELEAGNPGQAKVESHPELQLDSGSSEPHLQSPSWSLQPDLQTGHEPQSREPQYEVQSKSMAPSAAVSTEVPKPTPAKHKTTKLTHKRKMKRMTGVPEDHAQRFQKLLEKLN